VAFLPRPSLLPTTKMRKSSMVHLVHHFTSLETPAGHSLAAELLAAPLLHTRLRFIRQLLVMSGSPPILDSSTPPTLGQPSRPSRTSLRLGDIALGAASSSGRYPAVFAVAKVSGTGGIYRSDDTGVGLLPLGG
jgi:hypothetical protein